MDQKLIEKIYKLHVKEKLSVRELGKVFKIAKSTVWDAIDAYRAKNLKILFIPDMHIPNHHPGMMKFLAKIKETYKPTRVVGLGDEIDGHAISYHERNPDLPSAGDEFKKAAAVLQELYNLFPEMDLVHSNHGSLPYRRAKSAGMPRHFMKSYNEIYGIGDGWKWHEDMTIMLPNGELLYVHHGKDRADALQTSKAMGMSYICGHYHQRFAVQHWGNAGQKHFAVNGGCLVDDKSLAFAYNKLYQQEPILGCVLVANSVPILIPFDVEGI